MNSHRIADPAEPDLILPRKARLPINRCSLPAVILGSLRFQRHPVPLALDGVIELHRRLFETLDALPAREDRIAAFLAHMRAVFSLDAPQEAGLVPGRAARARAKASYLRMLRGWSFDPDGLEGAVLKGWVESRFGLLPRYHAGPIRDPAEEAYRRYLEARTRGLYGTNAIEAQLDLLYAFNQYEFGRRQPGETHIRLYRGVNRVDQHEILAETGKRRRVVLLNSLTSFTLSRERASEFGDDLMEAEVPLAKVFFHHALLPGLLQGEEEYVVIGGLYEVTWTPYG